MNVLLTGGAGYIGSHTAVELANAGYGVIIADDFSNSKPAVLGRLRRITGKNMPCYRVNVADKDELSRIFDENDIDAVIHFAGYKSVPESCREPLKYYRNNIDSTLSLLEVMAQYGVKRFVFSSSATVYGDQPVIPYVESMKKEPCTCPYGWTKSMIEQILTDTAAADSELSVVLLRYFNPVGAHSSGLIGEDPLGVPNNLMPYVAQVATGRREKLFVFGNDYDTPDGTGVRDYIHVTDLAKGHVKALEYAADHTGTEIFNLGAGRGYSVLELVEAFKRASGVDVPYDFAPRRPGDLSCNYSDPAKAERLLNWRTELSLDDICADTWRWQSGNPNGYPDDEE